MEKYTITNLAASALADKKYLFHPELAEWNECRSAGQAYNASGKRGLRIVCATCSSVLEEAPASPLSSPARCPDCGGQFFYIEGFQKEKRQPAARKPAAPRKKRKPAAGKAAVPPAPVPPPPRPASPPPAPAAPGTSAPTSTYSSDDPNFQLLMAKLGEFFILLMFSILVGIVGMFITLRVIVPVIEWIARF